MRIDGSAYRTIWPTQDGRAVEIIDQTRLPHDFAVARLTSLEEAAHAIRAAIVEAEAAREAGEERTILFNLSGHGHFDLGAYDAYLAGELQDPEFSEDDMNAALARIPDAPAIA